jgi:hypothetical protein
MGGTGLAVWIVSEDFTSPERLAVMLFLMSP